MIRAFATWPARYPIQSLFVLAILAFGGLILMPRVTVDRTVPVPRNVVQVQATLPGIDAERVEALVARPLEEALASLDDIEEVVTRSQRGRAVVELRFAATASRDAVLTVVRERVSKVNLPDGFEPPMVLRKESPPRPAAVLAITAAMLTEDHVRWTEQALRRPLHESAETATAALEGVDVAELLVQPDQRRMAALGLSFEDLIGAMRTDATAPPRRQRARRVVTLNHAGAAAVAARAVRPPDGESVPLAEVAEVIASERRVPLQHEGRPAVMLYVYPHTVEDAAAVARRVHAHVGWLRANGNVPAGVEIVTVFDESLERRGWVRQIWQRFGFCALLLLLVTYLFFGRRLCLLVLAACGAWFPALTWWFWGTGVGFTVAAAAGVMFAAVVLVLLLARILPTLAALSIATIAASALFFLPDFLMPYRDGVIIFAVGSGLGIVVNWLMSAWISRHGKFTESLWSRLWPKLWRGVERPWRAVLVAIGLITSVVFIARALPPAIPLEQGGVLTVRVQAADLSSIHTLVQALLARLDAVPEINEVTATTTRQAQWRLVLDPQRMLEQEFQLAQIGRAFAIAQEGLIVGEFTHAELQLPLRLQLPSGAAGEQFERLLLKGEQPERHAVYLRDIGAAEFAEIERERLRINGIPALEVKAYWRVDDVPSGVIGIVKEIAVPPSARVSWEISP